jgi:hypothetical protein
MMNNIALYPRNTDPFGLKWEKWAAMWCKWQLSIPRTIHPALDKTGKYSAQNQDNPNVWFLTGTFGNSIPISRTCTVPKNRSILFPIIYKEDSFAEDPDLHKKSELIARARDFADNVKYLRVTIDGDDLQDLYYNRVQSEFFDLTFPERSVYDVQPGHTTSICDGYWIFLKPLPLGKHEIHFIGIASLRDDDIVTEQIKNDSIYAPFRNYIEKHSSFKVDVIYKLSVL